MQGQGGPYRPAGAGLRTGVERTAQCLDALAHADQAVAAARGGADRGCGGASLPISTVMSVLSWETVTVAARVPRAWRAMLVRDSWTTRYTVVVTTGGHVGAAVGSRRSTAGPCSSKRRTRSTSCSCPAVTAAPSSASRSRATTRRMASMASVPERSMSARAAPRRSGCLRSMIWAAWVCITMPETWWATTSCNSLARARRSSRRTASTAAWRRYSRKRSTSPVPRPANQYWTPSWNEPTATEVVTSRPSVVTASPAAATTAARQGGSTRTADPARTASAKDAAMPGWPVRCPVPAARTAAAATDRPTATATSRSRPGPAPRRTPPR